VALLPWWADKAGPVLSHHVSPNGVLPSACVCTLRNAVVLAGSTGIHGLTSRFGRRSVSYLGKEALSAADVRSARERTTEAVLLDSGVSPATRFGQCTLAV
jgi:hypothetical protein